MPWHDARDLWSPVGRGVVRLDNAATLVEERGPAQIDRINRQRQVSFTANLQNLPIGDAIKKAEDITKSLRLKSPVLLSKVCTVYPPDLPGRGWGRTATVLSHEVLRPFRKIQD